MPTIVIKLSAALSSIGHAYLLLATVDAVSAVPAY